MSFLSCSAPPPYTGRSFCSLHTAFLPVGFAIVTASRIFAYFGPVSCLNIFIMVWKAYAKKNYTTVNLIFHTNFFLPSEAIFHILIYTEKMTEFLQNWKVILCVACDAAPAMPYSRVTHCSINRHRPFERKTTPCRYTFAVFGVPTSYFQPEHSPSHPCGQYTMKIMQKWPLWSQ